MRTTIDGAGRIVVPKAIRDAMGLDAGRAVDVTFADGRIEIEIAPAKVHIDKGGMLPVIRAEEDLPPLTDDIIRETLEATRR
ncbi:AbrB/MazE/SpoVT family DNA-binding domain-containing protein [Tsukamurella paurometabola]|uniref:AbrB/MazE/SpoVT family DNA-binding domain-containing protein n=1 Tax=Tsukamurella paurometabola TaxID=2061 RepID=A0A3P8L6D7_TSUPA|nr:AbrB/MazE/SpoVT family DNA-binding domain-containing protein [Tsukamurella paurometabola]MBS4102593.1 AbrB/MazE/SpoVT family DNA-binding domain-containing protein [Tsukamurella paurometabola]UEA81681.1 AbrB/MazE/SpoVT family DNA-binding domain-containing protein [Tsukamurella paurometabola]VDR38691.1 Antitoxin VapB40 [Tsukamurella paurometabola]